jgi:hypothetical protein
MGGTGAASVINRGIARLPMLTLGEVATGLLQNSTSVPPPDCARLLELVFGERVRNATRPIAYTVSPDLLTGVDCRLAAGSGARTVRGVGTVVSRAAVTGGHVLQGSTFARVARSEAARRLPWSHYLSRPGVVEVIGKAEWGDLATGFTTPKPSNGTLDLGAVSDRLMDSVQARGLDRKRPFPTMRTRLRWCVVHDGDTERMQVHYSVENDTLRTASLTVAAGDATAVATLCEDLALHDWLLTTLLDLVERSRGGPRSQLLDRLRPAIEYLLHLLMPAARVDQSVMPLWESLERRPGFSKQWRALVDRIRDQVAIGTVTLLSAAAESARKE